MVAVDGCQIIGGVFNEQILTAGTLNAQIGINIEPTDDGSEFCKHITITGAVCAGNAGPGFSMTRPFVQDVSISGVHSTNNDSDGFNIGHIGKGCSLSECIARDNQGNGYKIKGSNQNPVIGFNWRNNHAIGNKHHGIELGLRLESCNFEGGMLSLNGQHGMYINESYTDDCLFKGIHSLANSQEEDKKYDNFFAKHYLHDCTFVNLVSRQETKYLNPDDLDGRPLTNTKKPAYDFRLLESNDHNSVLFCDFTNGKAAGNVSISNITGLGKNIARGNKGFVTENNVLSDPIDISTIGIKEVNICHGLSYTPEPYECQITAIVEDATYTGLGSIWVRSADSTKVTAMVDVVAQGSVQNIHLALRINRFADQERD